MPSWIGPWELLIVLAVVILIFGPKRVPQAGRSLGRGMREFKDAITGKDDDDEQAGSPRRDRRRRKAQDRHREVA